MSRVTRLRAALFGLVFSPVAMSGAGEPGRDPETGALVWTARHAGVSVRLQQILPEQLRAFYAGRGFDAAQAEPYARACVFMTVVRNETAPGPVTVRRADWRVIAGGRERPPQSTGEWLRRLAAAGVPAGARLAFRWAQFPAEQTFAPGGDWNQGMLPVGLPPGERFDLRVRWTTHDGGSRELLLKEVRCASEDDA